MCIYKFSTIKRARYQVECIPDSITLFLKPFESQCPLRSQPSMNYGKKKNSMNSPSRLALIIETRKVSSLAALVSLVTNTELAQSLVTKIVLITF